MSTKSFLQNYQDTRLNAEDKEKLQTSFVEFGDLFAASWRLVKNNFVVGWVFPGLWSFLVQILGLILTFTFLFVSVLGSDFANYSKYYDNFQNNFQNLDLSFINPGAIFQFFIVIFLMGIVSSLLIYWIQIKQYGLLNDKNSLGIWTMKDNFLAKLGKLVLARLIIFALYLPVILVFILFIGFTANSFAQLAITQSLQTPQTGTFSSPSDIGLNIFLFLLFVILLILSPFIPGLVGLFEQLIIHENLPPLQAIKTSYKLSIQKFWPNIGRWFLFGLSTAGVSLVFTVIQQIIGNIFASPNPSNSDLSQISSASGVGFALLVLLNVVQGFVYWIALTAFEYTSFYNFRHTVFEKETQNISFNSSNSTESQVVIAE